MIAAMENLIGQYYCPDLPTVSTYCPLDQQTIRLVFHRNADIVRNGSPFPFFPDSTEIRRPPMDHRHRTNS
jgi:hypothetical protein